MLNAEMALALKLQVNLLLEFLTRRATIACVLSFVLAVVATLVASGRMSAILACGFDWTVFWTGAQAVAVSIAAIIALGQLRSYLSTERDKNTIALFQELDSGEIHDTIDMICQHDRIDQDIQEVRNALRNSGGKTRQSYSERLQSVSNMFDRMALQFIAGTINQRMYCQRMDVMTMTVYKVLSAVKHESTRTFDLTDFEKLATACYRYHERLPLCERDEDFANMKP